MVVASAARASGSASEGRRRKEKTAAPVASHSSHRTSQYSFSWLSSCVGVDRPMIEIRFSKSPVSRFPSRANLSYSQLIGRNLHLYLYFLSPSASLVHGVVVLGRRPLNTVKRAYCAALPNPHHYARVRVRAIRTGHRPRPHLSCPIVLKILQRACNPHIPVGRT